MTSWLTPLGPQMKLKAYVCALALLTALGGILCFSWHILDFASQPTERAAGKSKIEIRKSKLVSEQSPLRTPPARARLVEGYGRLPLRFEANSGQTDARVKFLSRGRGYTMFLTGDEAVLSLRSQKSEARSQNRNWKRETGNWKFETGRSKFEMRNWKFPNARSDGAGLESGIFNLPSLLPWPESLFQNPKSEIQNPPAPSVVRMKLAGANPKAKVSGLKELPGKSNYFIGNDPKKWRTNVPNYAEVKYEGVYPGIDLVYYGSESGQLEYDFVVAPGADPSVIAFDIVGAGLVPAPGRPRGAPLRIDSAGDLVIPTDAGAMRFHKPVVYQPVAPSFRAAPVAAVSDRRTAMGTSPLQPHPKSKIENPKSVDGRFVLLADNHIGFTVDAYDRTRPLIIDPVLSYATYLGGTSDDLGIGLTVDGSGNAYVVGFSTSTNFPVSPGAYDETCDISGGCVGGDVFLTKMSSDGSNLVFSTYLGGSITDLGVAVVLDASGSPYVTGATDSPDFPTTTNAFQQTLSSQGSLDAFVTKFAPAGDSLAYSTYLGGAENDAARALAVDSAGAAYVTGSTLSTNFPTQNALQAAFGAGTLCGFFADEPCPDAFVTKLSPDGSSLAYSTYLGRTGEESGTGIAVDTSGNAYVGGYTFSSDFPTMNPLQPALAGGYDGFVLKLNPSGLALVFSTFLGGAGDDFLQSLAIDSGANIYVTGGTDSINFPTVNASQTSFAGGDLDAIVTKLNATGSSLTFSAYLGGNGIDGGFGIAPDPSGGFYSLRWNRLDEFSHRKSLAG